MAQPRHAAREDVEPEEQVEPGMTMIYKPRTQLTEAASLEELGLEKQVAVLTWDGQRRVLDKRRAVLGRSREADIQIEDANVSRRHAEIVQEGSSYWLVDLGSTNGTEVAGKRIQRLQLEPGTAFTLGETTVTFSTERE
jgi:pSer/pThr/pTyr-binding forkhead associated (FHA) protein